MESSSTHTFRALLCFIQLSRIFNCLFFSRILSFRTLSGNLRYGSIPREAVCTENLTLGLKLLRCRDKAGLSLLMNMPLIYRVFYHSQRLNLTSGELDPVASGRGIVLEQMLTFVLQSDDLETHVAFSSSRNLQPSWSTSSLFGRTVDGNVLLQRPEDILNDDEGEEFPYDSFGSYPTFGFSVFPDRIMNEVIASIKWLV